MKSATRKTIMIDGIRYYAERPHDCRKCFFWKNRKVGCTLGRENSYKGNATGEAPSEPKLFIF